MGSQLGRRTILKYGVAAGIAGTFPGAFASTSASSARWAVQTPGISVLVTGYIVAKRVAEKHGLTLGEPTNYTSLSTYYNDFAVGNYDVCMGTWDTFAARYLAGVPVRYLCSISTAHSANIISPKGGLKDISELRGRRLAAPRGTGIYRITNALLKETYGFTLDNDVTVQGTDSMSAAVTLLLADRADAALSLEPAISTGLLKQPNLGVLFNLNEAYRKHIGNDLPFFGVAVRKELLDRDPGIAEKIRRTFQDGLAGIAENRSEAIQIAGNRTGATPDSLDEGLKSERLRFKFISMTDPKERENVTAASVFLARNALLSRAVDEDFYVTG